MINHFKQIVNGYNPNRMMSVDLLRGVTIFTMILVNNPGSWGNLYSPLAHAVWHGWTITDLVFPFFLFIVGLSIALSANQTASSCDKKNQANTIGINRFELLQIVARTVKLFLLGWLLGLSYYNFYDPQFSWFNDKLLSIRWFGVLQRIAIVYFVCAICFRLMTNRQLIILCMVLLGAYWTAMMLLPYIDNNGNQLVGVLLPGNNLAAYIDHHLFGVNHLYHKSTQPFASDPEGLLTTVPALVNCLIGILVAKSVLLKPNTPDEKTATVNQEQKVKQQIIKLLWIAFPMLLLAYIASNWFPFNKNLWSPPYVLLSSSLAIIVLALARWLIDLMGAKLWTAPFLVFGSNAIALFMLSGFVARLLSMVKIDGLSLKTSVYSMVELISDDAKLNSLCFALLFMLVMYCPLYWMYQKKLFWKV
jgi:predicted acyltransferase